MHQSFYEHTYECLYKFKTQIDPTGLSDRMGVDDAENSPTAGLIKDGKLQDGRSCHMKNRCSASS